jgi:hypothetical protein
MVSKEMALKLKEIGLEWEPQRHDMYLRLYNQGCPMQPRCDINEVLSALPELIEREREREAEKVCNAMQKLRAAASELRDSTHNNERVIYRTKLDIAEAEMWQALAEWEKDKEECQHGDIRD